MLQHTAAPQTSQSVLRSWMPSVTPITLPHCRQVGLALVPMKLEASFSSEGDVEVEVDEGRGRGPAHSVHWCSIKHSELQYVLLNSASGSHKRHDLIFGLKRQILLPHWLHDKYHLFLLRRF